MGKSDEDFSQCANSTTITEPPEAIVAPETENANERSPTAINVAQIWAGARAALPPVNRFVLVYWLGQSSMRRETNIYSVLRFSRNAIRFLGLLPIKDSTLNNLIRLFCHVSLNNCEYLPAPLGHQRARMWLLLGSKLYKPTKTAIPH